MKNGIEQIKKYIAHLSSCYGLYITIHSNGDALNNIIYMFPEVNIHSTTFCTYIKSYPEMWDKCIKNQKKIFRYLEENDYEMFFGSCYVGVGEYIVPIYDGKQLFGFISVGKYAGNRGKMIHAAEKYIINKGEMEDNFDKNLSMEIPDAELIETIVYPICAMLMEEVRRKPPEIYSRNEGIVNNALVYIHRNFSSKIGLAATAKYCHCSPRTLSRLFAERTGLSVGKYIENLRMERAQSLLTETALSVTEIAFLCGYIDPNYFSSRFTKRFGKNPMQMKKKTKYVSRKERE